MLIIGIAGRHGSGKDAVAEMAAERFELHGLNVETRALADNMKWALARLFWPTIEQYEAVVRMDEIKNSETARVSITDDDHEHSVTIRQFIQRGGSEMGRAIFGQDFWINQILSPDPADTQRRYFDVDVLLITDVRLDYEASRIRANDGIIWQVDRPGDDDDPHETEIPLFEKLVDTRIRNAGSLADLAVEVGMLVTAKAFEIKQSVHTSASS
jgi:hypothetical protein